MLAEDFRGIMAGFKSFVDQDEVARIAGYLAKGLGLVADRGQAHAVLGSAGMGQLMAVVQAAMVAWLRVKGSNTSYRLHVSGCREGKRGWQAGPCCACWARA